MQELIQHTITKIINKSGSRRDCFCDECNTSYPALKMLRDDHQNFNESKINEFKKSVRVSVKANPPTLSHSKSPNIKRLGTGGLEI